MAYLKTNWINDQEPALNDVNLNKKEEGIRQARIWQKAHAVEDSKFQVDIDYWETQDSSLIAIKFGEAVDKTKNATLQINEELTYSIKDKKGNVLIGEDLENQMFLLRFDTDSFITFSSSQEDALKSTDGSVKDFISISVEEYLNLKHEGKLVPNTLYNVQDETSAVLESGSNANGSWKKYTDGTMECWGNKIINNIAITTATGNLFRSEAKTLGSFPVAFVGDMPAVIIYLKGQNITSNAIWLTTRNSTNQSLSDIGGIYLLSPVSVNATTGADYHISWQAKGRWK